MILHFEPKPRRRDSKLYVKPAKVTPIENNPRAELLAFLPAWLELQRREELSLPYDVLIVAATKSRKSKSSCNAAMMIISKVLAGDAYMKEKLHGLDDDALQRVIDRAKVSGSR